MQNPLINQSMEKVVASLFLRIEYYGHNPCELLNPHDSAVLGELLHLMSTLNSMSQYREIRTELCSMVIKCHDDSRADNIREFCDGVASMMYPGEEEIKAAKAELEETIARDYFDLECYEKLDEVSLSFAKRTCSKYLSESELNFRLKNCFISRMKGYLKRYIYSRKSFARSHGFYDDDLDEVGYYPGLKELKPKVELIRALRKNLEEKNKKDVFLIIEEQKGKEELSLEDIVLKIHNPQNTYKIEDVLAELKERRF